MIPIEKLEEMFLNMRDDAPWDVDGELLWGYFFFNRVAEPLSQLGLELQGRGYGLVGVYPTDDGDDFVLHVEMAEHHTPQSLYARNAEFEQLAAARGIDVYDGMDVGPVQA